MTECAEQTGEGPSYLQCTRQHQALYQAISTVIFLPGNVLNCALSIHRTYVGLLTSAGACQQHIQRVSPFRIRQSCFVHLSCKSACPISRAGIWLCAQLCVRACLLSPCPPAIKAGHKYSSKLRATGRGYWQCLYSHECWRWRNELSRKMLMTCKERKLLFILMP